jgi:dTDP-4-dehydrorhamnose reductase
MFTVALIGASGLLGRAVADELARRDDWRVVRTAHQRVDKGSVALDLCDTVAVVDFVDRIAPDAIVVAAAERRPDICEREPARARALNVDAVRAIAGASRHHGAWVLSISTDYVFDGKAPPYRCESPPSPLNRYGQSKLDGEHALLDTAELGCVLRLPLLFGPIANWQESAVTSLVPAILASAAPNATPAVMDAWAIRYPTFTPDVASVIGQMLDHHARGKSICGITQWSGAEPMTKFDIATRLARALRVEAHLAPQFEPSDATPRPRDCHLDSSRLEMLGIGRRSPFDDAIDQVLRAFPLMS